MNGNSIILISLTLLPNLNPQEALTDQRPFSQRFLGIFTRTKGSVSVKGKLICRHAAGKRLGTYTPIMVGGEFDADTPRNHCQIGP